MADAETQEGADLQGYLHWATESEGALNGRVAALSRQVERLSARMDAEKKAELINLKDTGVDREERMQRLFRRKAEEGDAGFAIAYSLGVIADRLDGAAYEISRLADAKELEIDV